MAADRQRLAQALAAEAARRKMFESIPEAAGQGLPQAPEATNYGRDLENLSIGLGRGAVNQLEGLKGAISSPVETIKGLATGAMEAVRNPRIIAEALKRQGERGMSGPLGLGEVIGENVNMVRMPGQLEGPVMSRIDAYHGTANDFDVFDPRMGGHSTGATSGKQATWFVDKPEVAKGYAVYAAENAPIDRKLKEADRLEKIAQRSNKKEDWDNYDAALRQAEELESGSYDRRVTNARLLKVDIPDETSFLEVDAKGKTPAQLSAQGDIDSWLKVQLQKAKRENKQGVKILNLDDAAGLSNVPATHYAVFDPSNVKIKAKEKLVK